MQASPSSPSPLGASEALRVRSAGEAKGVSSDVQKGCPKLSFDVKAG